MEVIILFLLSIYWSAKNSFTLSAAMTRSSRSRRVICLIRINKQSNSQTPFGRTMHYSEHSDISNWQTVLPSQLGNRKFCLKRSDNFQQEKTLEFFRYLLIDKSTRQSLEKINTGSKSIIQTQTYQVSPQKSPLFSLCHKNGLTNTQYIYNFYLCSLTLTSLHRISPRVSVITFHNLEKRFITNSGITRW